MVLEVLLLKLGPEPLDYLRPGHLLALLGGNDLGQIRGDVQGHLEAGQLLRCTVLRHPGNVL